MTKYLAAEEYTYVSDGTFSGVDKKGKMIQEQPGEHHVIHILVPVPPGTYKSMRSKRFVDQL